MDHALVAADVRRRTRTTHHAPRTTQTHKHPKERCRKWRGNLRRKGCKRSSSCCVTARKVRTTRCTGMSTRCALLFLCVGSVLTCFSSGICGGVGATETGGAERARRVQQLPDLHPHQTRQRKGGHPCHGRPRPQEQRRQLVLALPSRSEGLHQGKLPEQHWYEHRDFKNTHWTLRTQGTQ